MTGTAVQSRVDTSGLPSKPGAAPAMIADQDSARAQALKLYKDEGVPFLRKVLKSKSTSERLKLDAVKELRSAALPPPQVHVGDVEVTIVVDL